MHSEKDDKQKNQGKKQDDQQSHHEPGAGITNRPDDMERENQERLPPRGQAKSE